MFCLTQNYSILSKLFMRRTVNWAARCSSINVINVIILLSNIYTFNKCLHIHKAYTKLMQETLNLKKGLILLKPLNFFFANDNKIIKLKCCENFKTWKCLEVGQMASDETFFLPWPTVCRLKKWKIVDVEHNLKSTVILWFSLIILGFQYLKEVPSLSLSWIVLKSKLVNNCSIIVIVPFFAKNLMPKTSTIVQTLQHFCKN